MLLVYDTQKAYTQGELRHAVDVMNDIAIDHRFLIKDVQPEAGILLFQIKGSCDLRKMPDYVYKHPTIKSMYDKYPEIMEEKIRLREERRRYHFNKPQIITIPDGN